MADNAVKLVQPDGQPQGKKTVEKSSDKLSLGIALLMVVNLVGLGGLGYSVQKLWKSVETIQNLPTPNDAVFPEKDQSVGKELEPSKLGVLYGLEAFLVNVPAEQGSKFLQLQMELELSDPSLEDELNRKKAAVRDAVIVTLSSKTYAELRGGKAMRELQQDLTKIINQHLTTGKVKEVFFTQFHFN